MFTISHSLLVVLIIFSFLDTAFNYSTEEEIGKVLKEWFDSGKLRRDEIFITTKVTYIMINYH